MDGLVEELSEGARAEMAVVAEQGGAVEAVRYMKARLVESHRERVARIESGEQKVIGQNSFTESEDSPLNRGRRRRDSHPRPRGRGRSGSRRWSSGSPSAALGPGAQPRFQELAEVAADQSANVDGGDDRRRPRRRHDRRVGRGPAQRLWRLPRPDRDRCGRAPRRARAARRDSPASRSGLRLKSGTGSRSWSESPVSTGTPTAPSRSPCAPATSGWR